MRETQNPRWWTVGVLLVLALSTAGCNKNLTTATPPPTPQYTVAKAVEIIATTLDATTAGMVAARDQGKMSQADLNAALTVAKAIAIAGKAINAELVSANPWETQKARILNIITTSGLNATYPRLSPGVRALLQASVSAFNQISGAVGGFQL